MELGESDRRFSAQAPSRRHVAARQFLPPHQQVVPLRVSQHSPDITPSLWRITVSLLASDGPWIAHRTATRRIATQAITGSIRLKR